MNATAAPTAPEAPPAPPAPTARFSALHVRVVLVALGLLGLLLRETAQWLRPDQAELFSLWAMIGLGLAAAPVLIDSLTSLKADGFEATKYYMDQFVALAILACFATGQYATGTIVAAILIIGQILEERATLGVEEAVKTLLRLSTVKARRLAADGTETAIDAQALSAGERVRILPGEFIPADVELLTGRTTVDQAAITGESLPVERGPGAHLYAGTTNLTGVIEAVVRQTGGGTVLGRVTRIVEEARASRAPVMRLIDEYTRYYMPFVLMIAGFTLFFTHDVQRAIAVIIVAMPCAFVLASPSAMIAALAVASRLGVLVKNTRSFEIAPEIDTVVFDKTGTLTSGRLAVTAIRPAPGIIENDLLALAARVEAGSTHPIARAVVTAASDRGLEAPPFKDVTETPGLGLRTGDLLVGRRSWLEATGVAMFSDAPDSPSSVHVARGGIHLGSIEFADTIRPEAGAANSALRALGIDQIVMLTGDRDAPATAIALAAGVDRHRADCLPEEKLAEVNALKTAGRRVLVVGDGVNDAPALAAGDLGIAMGALGSDVAIQTADVALMSGDLRNLPAFLRLSERTLRIINQNLLWGIGFIVTFMLLGALGVISPIVAAVLHEVSAFFVIFNSARLLRFTP